MKQVALLYFSAAGGTKAVAGLLGRAVTARLAPGAAKVASASIEDPSAPALAAGADLLVLLFPTYYLRPAPPMKAFVESLGAFPSPKPCYIVATCELYSENCVRSLAAALAARNLRLAGSKVVRATGSDVTAVLPSWLVPWLYRFGRRLPQRLAAAAGELCALLGSEPPVPRIPPLRWYTPLTRFLQFTLLDRFDAMKHRLRAIDGRCTRCGKCARECPVSALAVSPTGVVVEAGRCLLCCRCIHGCPEKAMVLIKALKDNQRIDLPLLERLSREAEGMMEGAS